MTVLSSNHDMIIGKDYEIDGYAYEEPMDEAEDVEDDLPDDQSQQMSFSTMDFSTKAPYQDETGDETE